MGETDYHSDENGLVHTATDESIEISVFLPSSTAQDDNGNEIVAEKLAFILPEPTEHPYNYETSKCIDIDVTDTSKIEHTEDGPSKKSAKCSCRNYLGMFWALGSGFIFTIGGIIVKYMKDYHPISLAFYRFQGVVLPALVLALYSHFVKKEAVFSTLWPLTKRENLTRFLFTIVRGILGGSALILLFYSIQNMPLADALVISSCRPVFVTFVAHVLLGEPCGIFPVFAAFLTIIGVGVIARPPMLTGEESFDKDTLMGVTFAFIGMLAAACSMVVLRYLRGVHVSLVTLTFGIYGTIITVVGSSIIGRFDMPTSGEHAFLVLCLAAATFCAQVGVTIAMKYEQAGNVAILRTFDTIYAFLLQFALFGTVPDRYSLMGAALIVFCVLLIAFRKWVSTLPEKHNARRRYWFVLK